MGTKEFNICTILAKRLKHIRARWSKKGSRNIAILIENQNKIIMNTVNNVYNDIIAEGVYDELEDIVFISDEDVVRALNKNESAQIKNVVCLLKA